jgi:acyl-coenzyme A synthetase/AMP-(fatty) acid ligase
MFILSMSLIQRERVTNTVLVPTMVNLLTQIPEGKPYDSSSLEVLAYGGSPMAPELVRRTRKLLPNVKLLQCYGLSETGFLTGLEDQEHVEAKLLSCGRPCPGIDLRVEDETGKEVEVGQRGELVAPPTSCRAIGTIRKTRLSHFETECFARETSAIRIQTVISTSLTA